MSTICWQCGKACGGCAWSDGLKPVKGWKVKHIKLADGDKIHVTACPEYVPETAAKKEQEVKRYVPTEDEKAQVRALRRQGWSIQRIMNATGLTQHYVEKYTKGITDKRKKIPKHIREEVRTMIKSGLSKREVARRTGISNNTVIKISREA